MTAPWQPTTAYAPGATVYGVPSTGFLYTASAGGTSGTSPPAFPTVLAGTVGDGSGSLVWTCTAVVADYSQFQVGNIVFPLAVAGGSTGVLQIADPALFYALDFWTFVIENYCGAAILAAATAAIAWVSLRTLYHLLRGDLLAPEIAAAKAEAAR